MKAYLHLSRKLVQSLITVVLLFSASLSNAQGWTVNPASFEFTGEVNAIVDSAGVTMSSGVLGAFVGTECRGFYGPLLGPAGYYFPVTVYSGLASGETLTFVYWNGSDYFDITETVAFTANMQAGTAIAPLTFHAIIPDTDPPTVTTCTSDISVSNDAGLCGATVTYTEPVFEDNVDGTGLSGTLTAGLASGSFFSTGVTTVTYEYYDVAGNGPATCSFTVTVSDNENPTITAPADVTVSSDGGSCEATGVALGTPVTNDNCSVASVVNNSTGTYVLGSNIVTWTVTDGSGNQATVTQTVIVEDNELPTITAPANVTVNIDAGFCVATGVVLGTPVTADNCSISSLVNDAPGSFPIGVTTVTWTVTDGSLNTASVTQTVTVVDNVNPTITAPADVIADTDADLCTASGVVLGTPVSGDNCTVVSVTNDAPAVFSSGLTVVIWTVTDLSGNTATATQNVTIQD